MLDVVAEIQTTPATSGEIDLPSVSLTKIKEDISHSSVSPEKTEEMMSFIAELPPKAQRALEFSINIHKNDFRKTGEPYIYHVLEVTKLVKERFNVDDEEVLTAALLHDTMEDNPLVANKHRLAQHFGPRAARMVDGLSKFKFDGIVYDEATHSHLFTMALAEPGILLIKLADRLHNMQTVDGLKPAKRVENCEETRDFYIPLAKKLGFDSLVAEYENLIKPYVDLAHKPSYIDKWLDAIHPHVRHRIADLITKRESEVVDMQTNALRRSQPRLSDTL